MPTIDFPSPYGFLNLPLNGKETRLDKINNYLRKMEEGGFPGSVLLASSGQILHLLAHGMSFKEKEAAELQPHYFWQWFC